MSSSFKDRLERLHGSRERAEERAEQEESHGVFSAEDAVERDHPPGEAPADEVPEPEGDRDAEEVGPEDGAEEDSDSETRPDPHPEMTFRRAEADGEETEEASGSERPETEVGEQLARSYSLRDRGNRGDSSGGNAPEPDGSAPDVSRETERSDGDIDASLPPNERAEVLRKRAEERIGAGDWEAALPVLHEIVAMLPRHAFALEKLARYHRNRGNRPLADHYESRLRDVSPF